MRYVMRIKNIDVDNFCPLKKNLYEHMLTKINWTKWGISRSKKAVLVRTSNGLRRKKATPLVGQTKKAHSGGRVRAPKSESLM